MFHLVQIENEYDWLHDLKTISVFRHLFFGNYVIAKVKAKNCFPFAPQNKVNADEDGKKLNVCFR